ncbi:hypothetical protein MPTK1_4g19760 [Marchantia polymorpha subsp. ruderalis]|uniref:3-oxo-5-alpha-steroid 4-dehydrogenase C-terminal domain-containing protein n=2 Tax=Marchantia polymorpha TaxID=3197 RepID=A0A176VW29_MARPO|nr:hypothetical protein AXG93_523s1130 [Marchantia polymorpha subsp. ruderalis]PTQ30301.1 hypothetical protein MARPO_0126s0018 [Marchantia polymorpha]BBN09441.1 hypothetical protein Mp_4g19760 [Marchantia polymorpha subsp. ruderalis]|eukprot:PTQ30301.1 hypothetical protein MARPO_0126s0018 [Marchantia polymorpha]
MAIASYFFPNDMSLWGAGYLKVMQMLLVLGGLSTIWSEALQKSPATYSKFADLTKIKGKTLPSRKGMLVLYCPAAIAVVSISVWTFSKTQTNPEYQPSMRFWLILGAYVVHFNKRILEVLFVHRYSGCMEASTAGAIGFFYMFGTVNSLLAQHIADSSAPPPVNTIPVGIALYSLGLAGNFYHHLLLSNLRKDGSRKYVVPQGGLFSLFVAPHYICEIVEYGGMALISQTTYFACIFLTTLLYLGSRSYATKVWYRKKVDGFPANRCALIPVLL